MAAFSTESLAWQMFFMLVMPRSPRMVPGGGLGGIGGAEQNADDLDGVFALQYESQYGARAHELHDLRKERPISNVRVVLLEQFVGERDEPCGADFKAGFFKAANHLAGVVAIETIGFQ